VNILGFLAWAPKEDWLGKQKKKSRFSFANQKIINFAVSKVEGKFF